MKKTTEQMQAEFTALMNEHGFTPTGETTYLGRPIYSRVWNQRSKVVWYGERENSMEIKVHESLGYPMIAIIKNGIPRGDRRSYASPKRAINAMREIVTYAGYTF